MIIYPVSSNLTIYFFMFGFMVHALNFVGLDWIGWIGLDYVIQQLFMARLIMNIDD